MTVASLLLLATLAALTVSLGARWRRREPDAGPDAALEGLVIQGALGLGLVGLAATGLAIAGVFSAMTLAGVCAILAATLWPWRLTAANAESAAPSDPRVGWTLPAGLVVVLLGLAVRAPLHPADLAGRDQGTYVLRAQHTLRTGAITYVDPVLAQASHDAAARARPGPADLLGLYPTPHDGWRADLYEAPYRPGFYLADRETGTVVPQFLHLHPMLLAVSGALFGARGLTWVMYWEAALTLLGCWAVTRRIWARRPIWALLATSLYALAPLAIWVQRTPLSEGLVGMLLMAAALALVRAPAGDDDDPRATWATLRCAALLGLTAWARGNLWMALPVVLLILFLQTGRGRARRASALLVALAIASLITHACTSFPYLHDEFRRQLALADGLPPARMIRAALACAVAWLALDGLVAPRLWRRPRLLRARAAIVRALPTLYLALCLAALALYVWGRAGADASAPFSRLDPALPLLGPLVLALAGVGLARACVGWRPSGTRIELWWLALLALPALALLLYARRNIPHRALYYYGRYLAPELLPVACALVAHALEGLHAALRRTSLPVAVTRGLTAAAALVALAQQSAALVTQPATRMQEFAGADALLTWLDEQLPEDAVVIAGGEGWHQSHTYNQVGGALAIGRGRAVLPYHSQEAAYAAAHELLVARPQSTGEPAPAVYLLINEATHNYRPRAADGGGPRTAAFDGLLPAPLRASSIALLELFVDRLTPVEDRLPVEVTRSELRMALLRVVVDPAAEVLRWRFEGGRVEGPPGLELSGAQWREGQLCLRKKVPLRIRLPPLADGRAGALVLVAGPGTAARNESWRVALDGRRLDPRMPAPPRPRPRDTLGPFELDAPPGELVLRGSPRRARDVVCRRGALAELRLLPPPAPALPRAAPTRAVSFGPSYDLGHALEPTRWVWGRALSRYRPGTRPSPAVRSLSLVLTGARELSFAPYRLPVDADELAGGGAPLDLLLTLKGERVGPDARVVVRVDDREVARLDPPDDGGTWMAPPLAWTATRPVVTVRLALEGAGETEEVLVRDLAFVRRAPVVESELRTAP